MPDGDGDDSKMAKQASSYVQDYTWNIFCIFTDIIDDLLKRSNIVTMVTRDVPYGMGKRDDQFYYIHFSSP